MHVKEIGAIAGISSPDDVEAAVLDERLREELRRGAQLREGSATRLAWTRSPEERFSIARLPA